jgi:DNA-binding NarL/FixJ family response regulator
VYIRANLLKLIFSADGKGEEVMNKLKILLADDHETVREGIKMIINSQTDMQVIGEASNGHVAVQKAEELQPDIIIMDISMPELNGLKATVKLKRTCPDIKILTLTRHTDDGYLQELLKAGANGYVLKQSASTELLRAIRTVATDCKFLDPAITDKVIGGFSGRAKSAENKETVSERENEILRQVAWGYSNKEIAAKLNLSVKTVEAHKANAMRKLSMRSRIDIVRYAILQGWLQET